MTIRTPPANCQLTGPTAPLPINQKAKCLRQPGGGRGLEEVFGGGVALTSQQRQDKMEGKPTLYPQKWATSRDATGSAEGILQRLRARVIQSRVVLKRIFTRLRIRLGERSNSTSESSRSAEACSSGTMYTCASVVQLHLLQRVRQCLRMCATPPIRSRQHGQHYS